MDPFASKLRSARPTRGRSGIPPTSRAIRGQPSSVSCLRPSLARNMRFRRTKPFVCF